MPKFENLKYHLFFVATPFSKFIPTSPQQPKPGVGKITCYISSDKVQTVRKLKTQKVDWFSETGQSCQHLMHHKPDGLGKRVYPYSTFSLYSTVKFKFNCHIQATVKLIVEFKRIK
jgi:hypothetical protein